MTQDRIWEQQPDSGGDRRTYTPHEVTSHIKQLFRTTDGLAMDLKTFRSMQDQQSIMLTEMNVTMKQVAAAVTVAPGWSIEHNMRLKKLEEDTIDQEERIEFMEKKAQCHGCKNEEKVGALQEFKKIWEPRLWMGFGELVLLQIIIGVIIKLYH